MTTNPFRYAQVHRFREHVAAHIDGADRGTPTVYMTPGEARALAAALLACANDVGRLPFTESTVGTARIEAGATPPPDELERIRAAVKAHDDRLNDDNKPGGSMVPTGDDYNDIFSLIMDSAPADPVRDSAGDMLASLKTLVAQAREVIDTVDRKDVPEWFAAVENGEAVIAAAEGKGS